MKIIITEKQLGLLYENETDYGFFLLRTNIPDYQALLDRQYSKLPEEYENQEAVIEYMTKDEYIRACAELQGTSEKEQYKFIDEKKVNKYMSMMQDGQKFNLGYLNYVNNTQEGRHRFIAAHELGQNKIPIIIIQEKENFGNLDEKIVEWNDFTKNENGDYVVSFIWDNKSYRNESKFLSCLKEDFDYYFLDEILFILKYGENHYDYNKPLTDYKRYINIDKFSDLETILPTDLYNRLYTGQDDEGELIIDESVREEVEKILWLTIQYTILKHNMYEIMAHVKVNIRLGEIIIENGTSIDNIDGFKSGKEMLLKNQIFEDKLQLYSPSDKVLYENITRKQVQKTMDRLKI